MALLGALIAKVFLSHIDGYSISNSVFIFLVIFLIGFSQATLGYALHKKNYKQIANIRALQGLGFVSVAVTPLGLLWSQSLSYLTALLPYIFLKNKVSDFQKVSIKQVLGKYKEFPMLSMPGAMLDIVGYSICIWIISFNYGVGSAGEYFQVQRIIGAPLMLVAISIAPLVLSKSIEYLNDCDRLTKLFWTTLKLLMGIALVLVCVTALVGEELLTAILGDAWRVNCLFITPIALAVAVRGCVSPLSGILIAKKRFRITLLWQALYLCSSLFFLGFVGQHLEFENFVLLYALHELVLYTIYIYFIYKALK
jgi:O-antigen/teichoic acid export membrane protein